MIRKNSDIHMYSGSAIKIISKEDIIMKNSKKFIMGAMAFALAAPLMDTSVFAATDQGTSDTPVTYYNAATETPVTPEWAFTVPSKIAFDADNNTVNANVKLTPIEGATATPNVKVNITVESKNAYNMILDGKTITDAIKDEKIEYSLAYGNKTMTNVDKAIGQLTQANKEISGIAKLKGLATQSGNFTDTLTYVATVEI